MVQGSYIPADCFSAGVYECRSDGLCLSTGNACEEDIHADHHDDVRERDIVIVLHLCLPP